MKVAVAEAVAVAVAVGVKPGVGDTQVSVDMLIVHPPVRLPVSPPASSTINSDHVPFGFVPLKTLRAELVEAAGAGAGNVSVPSLTLFGLNVPATSGPASGRRVAAKSSSVKVRFVTSPEPPASDIITAV